jgi:hypothetical protein
MMFREKGFQGIAGGRVLYQFVDRETYTLFGSIAVSAIFDREAQVGLGQETTFELETLPLAAVTVGAEGTLGSHFGLSGELGAGQFWAEEASTTQLAYGIGLHYYW